MDSELRGDLPIGQPTPTEIVFHVEESAKGGYSARAIGASIFTQAETLDDLRQLIQNAVDCHYGEGDRPRSPSPSYCSR
jgi:hypothetical protein